MTGLRQGELLALRWMDVDWLARKTAAEGGGRVEPVDGQLARALQVRALAAEPLEKERRVGDRQLVPAVDRRRIAVGSVVALRKLARHLVR